MAIDAINSVSKPVCTQGVCAANQTNYVAPNSTTLKNDNVELTTKTTTPPKEASTGKKWGVGIASFMLPGLGQAINGQWGAGFAFLGATIGAGILFPPLAPITGLIMGAWSATHAVKNATA